MLYSDFSVPEIILSLKGGIELPPHMNYGVTGKVKKLLFELLLPMSAQNGVTSFTGSVVSEVQEAMEREKAKANMFAKVVDLCDVNSKGLAFENRRRCVQAFSLPGKPTDTGCPEVQSECSPLSVQAAYATIAYSSCIQISLRVRRWAEPLI
jgi:small subunit ribosomal protein S15